MAMNPFNLAKQVGRVPSITIPLEPVEELRYKRLMEDVVMVDMHQHPMVCPDDMDDFIEYLRLGRYEWGYDAIQPRRLGGRSHRQRLPRHGRLPRTLLHRLR